MPAYDVSESDRWESVPSGEWNALLSVSAADTLFLRYEWLTLWWEHFGGGRRLVLLQARKEGRLIAALPLMETRETLVGLPIITLRSTTNAHSGRYNAICAPSEEEAIEAMWSFLRERDRPWQVVILESVPADAPVIDRLLRAAGGDGARIGSWHAADVPYLPTVGSWETFHASLSRNMRANLRKKGRRLAEQGTVAYRCLSSPEQVAEGLRSGLALEGSGWKAEQGSAIASDPGLTRFYTLWAERAARNGWLRLSLLEVNGKAVAFDLSTLYAGRYYDLKMGYDPSWADYSVGQLIKMEILRRCFESSTMEYDFLGVSTRAKEDWSPLKRAHHWHFIYAPTTSGRALHFIKFKLTPWVKRRLGQ